jgi:leucyl aminopeptidase (aminopeptidase T)
MGRLLSAARRTVRDALKVRKKESVLLVTDRQKIPIAEALGHWLAKSGAETTTYLMTETLRPIVEPTALFMNMLRKADVTIYMLDPRIEEKGFRSAMVKEGSRRGRVCMLPGITVDMMERLIDISFGETERRNRKVIRHMNGAREVRVTNPYGTNLTFSVWGRKWINSNGDISRKGSHGNLPAGESFTCPVEKTFNGRVVFSLIDDKLGRGSMVFEKGRVVDHAGRGIAAIMKHIGSDRSGHVIGEFGIGTNRGARICKNMLEAEKAFSTVHFAIGDSYGLGRNRSPHHYDALVEKVTLIADGKTVMRNGRFTL